MYRTGKFVVAAALAGAILVTTGARGEEPGTGVDISGTWILNKDLSDDPREIMEKRRDEAMQQGRMGGNKDRVRSMRGGAGGGGYGGGYGGGMPGGPGGGDRAQMQERLRQMEAPKKIVIVQTDGLITMIPEGRDTVRVVPDGEKHKQKTVLGDMDVAARWKDLALELTTTGTDGRELKRRFLINDDGRLEVVTEVTPARGDKIEIVMRYDEAP